jgi:hypothetical protein
MPAIPRDPGRWEALQWMADLAHLEGRQITDPASLEAIAAAVRSKVGEILGDRDRLRGVVHEAMFENLLVELGQTTFIKREDAGAVRADARVRPPDLRVTLKDGRCLLVELKTTRTSFDAGKGVRIPKKEFMEHEEYARRASGELWFGTFWEGPDVWTLNAPSDFRRKGKYYVLDFGPAIVSNGMGMLGDVQLATVPPLRVRINTDPSKAREIDAQGLGQYTIQSITITCDGQPVTDEKGRNLAFFMFMFGRWPQRDEVVLDGQTILSIEWTAEPEPDRRVPDQLMQFVGTTSSLYARMFKLLTTDETGSYVRLRLDPVEGRLLRLAPSDFPFGTSGLRLLIMEQVPRMPAAPPSEQG